MRTALQVFAQRGYKETNLTLIAQECSLSRTTVYQYFSSVENVLLFSVKTVTDALFEKYNSPSWQGESTPFELVERICADVLDEIDLHSDEITNFILGMRDMGIDLRVAVRRRTAKLNLFLSRLLRSAQGCAQVRKCSVHDCVTKLFIFIESYCFHLVFFEEQTTALRELMENYLSSLKVCPKDEKQEQL